MGLYEACDVFRDLVHGRRAELLEEEEGLEIVAGADDDQRIWSAVCIYEKPARRQQNAGKSRTRLIQ